MMSRTSSARQTGRCGRATRGRSGCWKPRFKCCSDIGASKDVSANLGWRSASCASRSPSTRSGPRPCQPPRATECHCLAEGLLWESAGARRLCTRLRLCRSRGYGLPKPGCSGRRAPETRFCPGRTLVPSAFSPKAGGVSGRCLHSAARGTSKSDMPSQPAQQIDRVAQPLDRGRCCTLAGHIALTRNPRVLDYSTQQNQHEVVNIGMARYAIWSAARQWKGAQKSLVSACGGLGLRPASQCHFDAISGPEFQFEAHKVTTSSLARRPPRAPCRTSGADAQAPIGTAWWLAAVSAWISTISI
jgi:hypothetical protein